jgi:hypothetical protein
VTSRGLARPRSSPRPLPAVILLLLGALGVALGPALAGRSVSAPPEAAVSAGRAAQFIGWTVGTVGNPAELGGSDWIQAGTAGDERDDTTPGPRQIGLRHPSAGSAAVERPTFHAVPPGVVVAGALLVLAAGYGGDERGRGLTLPRGSARSPPASAA